MDGVTFKPIVGLNGYMVISQFDINNVDCKDFNQDVYQLAVILYPPEELNEKFLIRLRDCVLKLSEGHPLKRWMKWVATSHPLNKDDQKIQTLLSEIINTKFNLITDKKTKNEIIKILHDVPDITLSEKLIRSYLYLMIGNTTRSDNILKDIINMPPKKNWQSSAREKSLYHRISSDLSRLIFEKMAKHPVDRGNFELFALYVSHFYNDPNVQGIASEVDTSEIERKINLKYVESIAPYFVQYLRLLKMSEIQQINYLRSAETFSFSEQAYWIWPFLEIGPLISESMLTELDRLEKNDELWFIYLLKNEKLADFYAKKRGKIFLPGRRKFLKSKLEEEQSFMLGLYKLIELGDINQELILKTVNYLTND